MADDLTVVSIDDDVVVLNGIVSALRDEYKVRPFTSAETALEFLGKNKADIILLDCNMPLTMSGFEALAAIKDDERLKKIPVIFLTGETDQNMEVQALKFGAADYLRKPFEPHCLSTRVKLQADLSQYQNNLEAKVLEKTEEVRATLRILQERDRIMLNMLAELSDLRDHDTGMHIIRTTYYSKVLAQYIYENPQPGYRLTKQEADDIVDAMKLHDLGKISVPDSVLLKAGRLTPEEFDIIKMHPAEGAKILEKSITCSNMKDELFNVAYDIAYEHHEKWNGTGYPRGISGTEIKLSARIAAIADVFDALTSERPYKRAFPTQDAFNILYKDSGAHFDPYLIEIVKLREKEFCAIVEEYGT